MLAVTMMAVVPLGTGAGADPTFVAGSGRARASLFEIVPRTGGLEIPINFGKALATYRGLSATATSGGVKPPSQKGADGDCGGGAQPPGGGGGGGGGGGAPAPPSPGGGKGPSTTFPFTSTLSVSTGDEGAEKGREIDQGSFPVGSPVTGRFELQQVWATAVPSARATTTAGSFGLQSGVEILNGRTDADVEVIPGRARQAHAVTTIDRLSLFGDAVTLLDLRWEATQRTGEGEGADGHFTVGKVLYEGRALPPHLPVIVPGVPAPALPDPLAALNTALAPSGIAIETPHLDTAGGVARVTPLTVRFADSALGRVVLGPVVGSLQPLRDPVVGGLLAISCDFGTAVTVADVATSILTGSGGISFAFGGVTATTEGEVYDNPLAGGTGDSGDLGDGGFGSDAVPGLPDLGSAPTPTLSGPAADFGAGTGSPDGFSASAGAGLEGPSAAGTGAGSGAATNPAGDEVAFADPAGLFGSTSRHVPGHKGGRALVVAALALLTVAALAAADAFHLRRASRSIS
ncbi:MAG TPA: hypothetical protein VG034_16335 [Acidimicrobiia bacterium]|nr:hypothetical protein [Acidimicrobiia bacterium]